MICGAPIEIKTNCQALQDMLLNKKQSSTHVQWEESIVSQNIVDIQHRLGVTNMVADAISRKWAEVRGLSTGNDGADWLVQLDWEAGKGIVNDIMRVEEGTDGDVEIHAAMRERFKDNPWLREVVKALTDGELGNIRTWCRARHRAFNFTIKDSKLWQI